MLLNLFSLTQGHLEIAHKRTCQSVEYSQAECSHVRELAEELLAVSLHRRCGFSLADSITLYCGTYLFYSCTFVRVSFKLLGYFTPLIGALAGTATKPSLLCSCAARTCPPSFPCHILRISGPLLSTAPPRKPPSRNSSLQT